MADGKAERKALRRQIKDLDKAYKEAVAYSTKSMAKHGANSVEAQAAARAVTEAHRKLTAARKKLEELS